MISKEHFPFSGQVDSMETITGLGTLFFLQLQKDNPNASGMSSIFFMMFLFK
jgi:hypothetical protein